jgi:hypothetical protein
MKEAAENVQTIGGWTTHYSRISGYKRNKRRNKKVPGIS